MDSPPPFSLVQTHIQGDGEEFQLFPYWVVEWRKTLYRENFYRFTKNCLFRTVPHFSEEMAVWLFGGLPGYWSYEYLRSVGATIPPELRPIMFKEREWALLDSLLSINTDSARNLLNWTPSGASDWFLALNTARDFWKVVHDTYGAKAVARFIRMVGKIQKPTLEQLAEMLVQSTGPDVKSLLSSFPNSIALRVLSEMRQEIDRR